MLAQVITLCNNLNGTLQQALMLARALTGMPLKVRLVSLSFQVCPVVYKTVQEAGIELFPTSPDRIPESDISIVVGLWDQFSVEAASRLVHSKGRLILAPTIYWHENLQLNFGGRAETLWFVSWDQAVYARRYWDLADQVEVVRCAVDINRFQPSGRVPTGRPWVLCRHSWDRPAKFASDATVILHRLGNAHDMIFNMLGAAETVGQPDDKRIRTFAQDAIDPAVFLQQGDIWVYAHARYWRETACIAMLEAMACGLPTVVNNVGGMREYLVHGRTGFVCIDIDEYVEFTRLLLAKPVLRNYMAIEARRFVQQYYSLESLTHCLKKLLKI